MTPLQIDFGKDQQEPVVGIDLGTTNSLVAHMDLTHPRVIPGEDGDRREKYGGIDPGINQAHQAEAEHLADQIAQGESPKAPSLARHETERMRRMYACRALG